MAAPHLVGYILLRYKLNLAHRERCVNVYQCQSKCPPQGVGSICITEKLRDRFVGIQTLTSLTSCMCFMCFNRPCGTM